MYTENVSDVRPEPKTDLDVVTKEITKKLLNDYEPEAQKQILDSVKKNLVGHYEQLRQNHLKGAEHFAIAIEKLQS